MNRALDLVFDCLSRAILMKMMTDFEGADIKSDREVIPDSGQGGPGREYPKIRDVLVAIRSLTCLAGVFPASFWQG